MIELLLAPLFSQVRMQWALILLLVVIGLFAASLAIFLSILVIRWIWKLRWRRRSIIHYVHMRNTGNVDCELHLLAVSPDQKLKFNYRIDGAIQPLVVLPPPAIPEPVYAPEPVEIQPEPPPTQRPARATASGKNGIGSAAAKSIGKANEAASNATGIAAFAIDILNTLGSLIPGPVGASLKSQGTALQQQASRANSKLLAPRAKLAQASHLKKSLSNLPTGKGASSAPEAEEAPAAPGGVYAQPRASNTGARVPSAPVQAAPPPPPPPLSAYIDVPVIEPETSLTVELLLEPADPYQGGDYTYWVLTHQPDKITFLSDDPVEKSIRKVEVLPLSRLYWVLSLFLSALTVVLHAGAVGWLMVSLINVIF